MDIISHRLRTKPNQIGNSEKNLHLLRNLMQNEEKIWIETDASLTINGRIIIYHPGSTRPDLTSLSQIELANSIFEVMTLEYFLYLLVCFPYIYCCLDIKQNSKELVQKIVKMVIDHELQNRVYITAFQKRNHLFNIESDGQLLLEAKGICPFIKTHLIVTWPSNLPRSVQLYKPDAVSFGWLMEPPILRVISKTRFKIIAKTRNLEKQICEVKGMGVKVWAGITNDKESIEYFINLGVDGIMTDNPALIIELIQRGSKNG